MGTSAEELGSNTTKMPRVGSDTTVKSNQAIPGYRDDSVGEVTAMQI